MDSRSFGASTAVLGHQEPRILHLPNAVPSLGHVGREAVELAEHAGLQLDPWQQIVLEKALGKRDIPVWNEFTNQYEYKWAAREVGLMISRQNGKGSILEARELAGLFLFGERLIIHSAHQFDTSIEAFNRILMLIEQTPDLDAEVARVGRSHGEEGIELKSGQRLRFRTRTKGGGRGFTGDCLILDEAMILDKEMVKSLMPTLSARPNVQIWYTGSAGGRSSTQFGRVRSRAMKCTCSALDHECIDPLLYYAEWSAELCNMFCGPDCPDHDDPADERTWAKANAAYGIRIDHETCSAEYRSMDPDAFAQERLGVGDWPVEDESWLVIPKVNWMAREDHTSVLARPYVLGVDISPDRSWGCITAAGGNQHGDTHVEITGTDDYGYDYHQGVQWIVPRVRKIWDSFRPEFVVIDPASQAGSLIPLLEHEGITVKSPTSREFAQGCGDFGSGIVPRHGEQATITHIGQEPLNKAVAGCDKRTLADMWAWSKSLSSNDISPLVAATLAVWGYKMHVYQKQSAVATPWVFRR